MTRTCSKWGVRLYDDNDCLMIWTPWFHLEINCGGMNPMYHAWLWEVNFMWGGDWDAPVGCFPYKHWWGHCLRCYTWEQAVNNGGPR